MNAVSDTSNFMKKLSGIIKDDAAVQHGFDYRPSTNLGLWVWGSAMQRIYIIGLSTYLLISYKFGGIRIQKPVWCD